MKEVDEEYEEKVNLTDFIFLEPSYEKRNSVLNGKSLQCSSLMDQPTLSRNVQKEDCDLESKYGLKEGKLILKRLVLPLSTIKQEKFDEEDNFDHDDPEENDSWIDSEFQELTNILNGGSPLGLDIKEEAMPIEESHPDKNLHKHQLTELTNILNGGSPLGLDIKEEVMPIEESHPDKNLHKHQLTVEKRQARNTRSSTALQEHRFKCHSCNYVFGVILSFLDHNKICNGAKNICRTILESIIDAAVTERTWKRASENENKDYRRPVLFKFACCEEIFSTFIEFNSHKFSKHNISHLICGLCYCKVSSIQYLYKHYGEHHFPGLSIRFDDQMNNSILTRRDSTSRHKTAEDMEECLSFKEECTAAQQGILCQCRDCSSDLSTENSIKTSISRPFVCKTCNMTFAFKNRLKRHEKTHLGLKPFPCNICAVSFTKQLTLDRHKLTQHSSEPSPFQVTCNICSKQLSCKSALNKHIRYVHGKQDKSLHRIRIPCPHCPKTLADKKSLSRHVKKHLQDTEYTCADCNRSFYCKEILVSHIKSQHLPNEILNCEICGYSTSSKMNMSLHKIKKHSDWRYSCDICGKRFPVKANLETHQVMHFDDKPFVCKICGKAFKRESNLDQHQYTHSTERSHLCSVCGLSFRLRTHVKQHMAVHGVGNNHKCLICNKFFARKRELNLHMSSHDVP